MGGRLGPGWGAGEAGLACPLPGELCVLRLGRGAKCEATKGLAGYWAIWGSLPWGIHSW